MNPATVAQIVLALNETLKMAELLQTEDLTPAQKEAVRQAVRNANQHWEEAGR